MNFKKDIHILNHDDFESMFNIMKDSFPSIERRTYDNQFKLLNEKSYKLKGIKDDKGKVIAFIAVWEFEKFNFIEHFAVNKDMRQHGIGTHILKSYIESSKDKNIILEVEMPDNDEAVRRIHFYNRSFFKMNLYEYMQPPLRDGNPLLPLRIMSYPEKLDKEIFDEYVNIVYENVYKVNIEEIEVI